MARLNEVGTACQNAPETGGSRRRWPFWFDLSLKTVLFTLLAVTVAFPDLAQFAGKAMTERPAGVDDRLRPARSSHVRIATLRR